MSASKLYRLAVFFLFLGFIAFIPLGPYPIPIFGTKLDIVFAVGLFFLLIPLFQDALKVHSKAVTAAFGFYVVAIYLSVILSENVLFSFEMWLISMGYIAVSYIAPAALLPYAQSARTALFGFAVLTAFLILWLYQSGAGDPEIRFSIGEVVGIPMPAGLQRVDPNHTAIGLMLSVFAFLPNLSRYGATPLKIFILMLGICAVIAATIIMVSRTAIVASIVGIVMALTTLTLRGSMRPQFHGYFSKTLILIPIVLLGGMAVIALMFEHAIWLMQRLLASPDDNIRITLLESSWDAFTSNIKTVWFGYGFMLLNPHNEYMRNLATSGIVGWLSFVLVLGAVYISSVRRISGNYLVDFGTVGLFWFIAVAITFYPLVKPLWVALLFLLLRGVENRCPRGDKSATKNWATMSKGSSTGGPTISY